MIPTARIVVDEVGSSGVTGGASLLPLLDERRKSPSMAPLSWFASPVCQSTTNDSGSGVHYDFLTEPTHRLNMEQSHWGLDPLAGHRALVIDAATPPVHGPMDKRFLRPAPCRQSLRR